MSWLNKIHCKFVRLGDFRNFRCPSEAIVLITDPPYGLNKKYEEFNDDVPFQDWVLQIYNWSVAPWTIIFAPYQTMRDWLPLIPIPHRVLMWHRTFVLPSQHPPDWTYSLTPIIVYKRENAKWYGAKRNDRDWHDCIDAHSGMGDIMRLKKLFPEGYVWHPAVTGTSIISKILNGVSQEGDLIVDPMCGIGSILVASIRLNRKVFGIELVPKYQEFANRWLEKECC